MHQDTSVAVFADTVYQSLGKKTFWLFVSQRISFGAFLLVLALGLSVARQHVPPDMAYMLRGASWIAFLLALLSIVIAFAASRLAYKSTGFMVSLDALKIKRGVFRKEEMAIPYRQIQNIEIERTFGQQMLGLSTVIILTAAHENDHSKKDAPESVIPAIDKEVAVSLRDEILKRANIHV